MGRMNNNNKVLAAGKIHEGFVYSHSVFGEKFYYTTLKVDRLSGHPDLIPLMVSDRILPSLEGWQGALVEVAGEFRSHNKHEGDRNRLLLSVLVHDIHRLDAVIYEDNYIELDGYICKKPTCRKTPLGREISDLLLAVNRPNGKSDYIPCITWSRNAKFTGTLDIGAHIKLCGRIQSREYVKRISDTETEKRTAYEVSVSKLEVVEEQHEEGDKNGTE